MKLVNRTRVAGLLYEHKLEKKISGDQSKNPGTEYITGTISIATDDEGVNIVPVHFTYVTSTTAKGTANATYGILNDICEGRYKTIVSDGKEKAVKLRVDSAIGLNEFYSDRNSQNGELELVSVKRNEGGFVHVTDVLEDNENMRNTFEVDIVISGVTHKDADEERNLPEKAVVKGAIFDFRGALLPAEFSVIQPEAISYFESLNASHQDPVFTRIRGNQISEIVTRTYEEESAFGAPQVREVKSTHKDFVITWAKSEPYEWDTEDTMTAKDLIEKMTARDTYLATLKQRQIEYTNSVSTTTTQPTTASGNWNF